MRRLLGQTVKLSSRSSKKNSALNAARLIELGRVVNTHGVRGEVRLLPHAASCVTVRPGLDVILRHTDATEVSLQITQARPHASFVLLKFVGIDSRGEAEPLRDTALLVEEAHLPQLEEGEFYHYQVIGLPIQTMTHQRIGTIAEVLTTQAHDILVVRDGDQEYLIPVVEDVVRAIDIKGRFVTVDPPEGLLENE